MRAKSTEASQNEPENQHSTDRTLFRPDLNVEL